MTHEEMRIALVDACPEIFRWNGASLRVEWIDTDEETDPLNDLNAMNEAVMAQPKEVRYKINHELLEMLRPEDHSILDGAINATASQRAEAFCRTLWPERFLTNPRAAEGTPSSVG